MAAKAPVEKKKSVGAPKKRLTEEQIKQIDNLAGLLTHDQMADYFKISRTTWQTMLREEPDIFERYKSGRAKAIAMVADGVLAKALKGDAAASFFYLKTQAGWRETNKVEHSGPDGEALKIEITRRIVDPKGNDDEQ